MKINLHPQTGWVIATFSLLAFVLLSVSSPVKSDITTDEKQAVSTEIGMDPFIGEITMFAGNFAPRGWALCDGQLLPISQNSALFSILGTTYGGDGRTTFALPDLRGRVAIHPGNGPGLSDYRLGQKGGAETITYPSISAVTQNGGKKALTSRGAPASNIQPYNTVNYIIALQGVYPSRN